MTISSLPPKSKHTKDTKICKSKCELQSGKSLFTSLDIQYANSLNTYRVLQGYLLKKIEP